MLKTIALAVVVTGMSCSVVLAKQDKNERRFPAKVVKAPEIDGSSAVAGLTLLIGGIAVLVGRRSTQAS